MVRVDTRAERGKRIAVGLAGAAIGAVLLWLAYGLWIRSAEPVVPAPDISALMLQWRCPQGHVFEDEGGYAPRPCPVCGQPAYIVMRYKCHKHGIFKLRVMYDAQTHRVYQVELKPNLWVRVDSAVPCPVCREPMVSLGRQRGKLWEKPKQPRRKAGGTSARPPS